MNKVLTILVTIFALLTRADVYGPMLKRAEIKDGIYLMQNGATAEYAVSNITGACEISYKFKITERRQEKPDGYAFMLNVSGGDAAKALFSMRGAKMLESYFYKNGKKVGGPKYTGDGKHPDGEWHEAKLTILGKSAFFTLNGRELANGHHSGLLPIRKVLFSCYGVSAELKEVTITPIEEEQQVYIEQPVFQLDTLTDTMSEFALTNPVTPKVGGIMFWARSEKDTTAFQLCSNKQSKIYAGFSYNNGSRFNINVKRTDEKNTLVYTRSFAGKPGDWVLITLTWNEDAESKYFINTLPYWVCFNPGQRAPEFLNADVGSINRIVFPELAKRSCEIRRLKIFHRPINNREVWDEYRSAMPIDAVMNETVIPADVPSQVKIQIAPGGYYTRPCPVQLDEFVKAKVNLEFTVRDKDDNILITDKQTADVNAPLDITLPEATYKTGNYRIVMTVNGFYQRTMPFSAFTSDYKPEYSENDIERGEMIYERAPQADDADIFKQGPVTMRNTDVGEYLECGRDLTDRIEFTIPFPPEVSGEPVILEVEWPDDKPRLTGLYMYPPVSCNRDNLQQAISSGYEIPLSMKMQRQSFLFYPTMTNYLFEARTLAPRMPAAIKTVRIYKVKGGKLPANNITLPKGMKGRHFGFYDEDQTFHNNLNTYAMRDKAPCHEKYCAKYPCTVAYQNDEYFKYFDYIGMDTVSEPVWRYQITYFPLEGQTGNSLWPGGSLGWVWNEFAKRNHRFIASMNYGNIPDVKYAEKIDGNYLKMGMEMLDKFGDPVPGYLEGPRTANPCHQKCVELLLSYMRDPVTRYAKSGLAGIQYEIITWGTWNKLDNGYDDFTTGKFTKDTGIAVPENIKDRYSFLTGEKREEWLKWRAQQITNLVKAIRDMLDSVNPDMKLELIVPAGYEARYVERGLDIDALKQIPNVTFCVTRSATTYRHDMHWSKEESTLNETLYDFTQADAKDLAVNGEVSVRSSYCYFETFVNPLDKKYNCYFENADAKPWGRHFLREAAFSLAAYDMIEYTAGGQPLPSVGHEAEFREFARAFRALPAKPFKDVTGIRDPVVARYLDTDIGTYYYLVNVFHENVTVSFDCGNGKVMQFTLKPYETKSGLLEGVHTEISDLKLISVDPTANAFYAKRITDLEAALTLLREAKIDVADETNTIDTIKKLINENRWAELYRVAYCKQMNQLLKKSANIANVVAEQKMADTGNWKVNCGSSSYYTANDGSLFIPDVSFNGKYGYVGKHECAAREISDLKGTEYPELFKSEAYFLGKYRFKVPEGKYDVVLHMKFAFKPGFREDSALTYSVDVNGNTIFDKVNMFKAQNGDFMQTLRIVAESITPQNGEITITWHPEHGTHPSVPLANAIEIIRQAE